MTLSNRVRIARRFLRSIRIDSDFGDATSLEGFVCPQSSADILLTMARHVSETGQGAYTWTGPYGSGKSSLVVALSALLNGNAGLQREAAKVFGQKLTKTIRDALPTGTKGWRVLPVVARRDNPVAVIGEAVKRMGLVSRQPRGGWTETNLITTLTNVAAEEPKSHGGLLLFIDEMGKFLEPLPRTVPTSTSSSNLPRWHRGAMGVFFWLACYIRRSTNMPTAYRTKCVMNGRRFRAVSSISSSTPRAKNRST